ncbi:long-chain fatty acid--CoA ligase [Dactylosporangium aurantiacum]|uniref:Acyl-CoA synthetase n=1 Tax=Dactylosporangium aurantiacum TaxID=35754 RepID=A0A9Q9ID79_9ACTN|nr:long-chain fatty acid--CoA ligase [Dactylosporangium aurantiacum]MDG6101895.1 long-chain fatty acid--CoA ligase [Dactylosporangium aurantiacum]UWZ52308.1 long-chain fatty acid--CoA ligase [Dactylosporangium aurantiacum]
MQYVAVEPVVNRERAPALAQAVWDNAREDPDAVQFVRPDPDPRSWPAPPAPRGGALPVSCATFRDDVLAVARGFVAAGVEHGDRVALISRTRYEWTLVDYALWTIGAVTVPVYDTSSREQIEWILGDSEAVGCVVETGDQAATVAGLQHRLPALRTTWQIDAGDLIALAGRGRTLDEAQLDARRERVSDADLATIVYTSGTTGRPKGCTLTHHNLYCDAAGALAVLPQLLHPGASTVLFLPLAHAFARLIQVGMVQARATMVHTADIAGVQEQLDRHRPTFVLAVPRVFEKLHAQARQQAAEARRGWLFTVAERVAVRYSRALDTARGPGALLRLAHTVCDLVAYRRLRAALGGRCRTAIVGGAPLGTHLGHFFRGAGVTVLEGYGLTETSPALTVNTPAAQRIGTVGRPLPGVELRIADDGEIQARGDVVFPGYWNNPDATRATFTADGWLRTGDLGSLDRAGFLRITGRRKEVIVTAAGKNLTPAPLEEAIRTHPLVSQCVLVGDGRPYVAALVTIDPQAWTRWRSAHGRPGASLAELRHSPELRSEIQPALKQANRAVSKAEQVKTFRILPRELTEADGELTPTLKVKRNVVAERYAADIDALYGGR